MNFYLSLPCTNYNNHVLFCSRSITRSVKAHEKNTELSVLLNFSDCLEMLVIAIPTTMFATIIVFAIGVCLNNRSRSFSVK